MRVAREIAFRNQDAAVGPKYIRGSKTALRGGYYLSPWLRDLQNCKELLDFFDEMVGEPLVPHCTFSNVPQVRTIFKFCNGKQQLANHCITRSISASQVLGRFQQTPGIMTQLHTLG